MLRQKAPFVWNATHLSLQTREKTLGLLFAYGAEVELVYVEQPRAELLRRNGRRDTSLTNKALEAMLTRWEPPLPTEAHMVAYRPGKNVEGEFVSGAYSPTGEPRAAR
jgi:predicted kinase